MSQVTANRDSELPGEHSHFDINDRGMPAAGDSGQEGVTCPVLVDELQYSDLRPYRIAFLNRISRSQRVSLTVWHGPPRSGIGAPESIDRSLPVMERFVENVFWPGSDRVMWQRGALQMLRSPSDVLVCAEVLHNPTVWVIGLLHHLFGKPLILRGHFFRSSNTGPFSGLRRFGLRLLHKLGDTYVPYSEKGRAVLLDEGVDPERVFVSQNTLDTEHLMRLADEVDAASVASLEQDLNLGHDRVLLYVGRLDPRKRVDVAIRAAAHMDRVALVIVGDGQESSRLRDLSSGLPVRFVAGTYDEPELARYFAIADLLVLPGRIGLTCVHGFANGVPCVTISEELTEQSPEYAYVRDDYNGLVLSEDNPEALARALKSLLGDRDRIKRLRLGAVETARRLTMSEMVTGYEEAVVATAIHSKDGSY